jgi:hypothetical protein
MYGITSGNPRHLANRKGDGLTHIEMKTIQVVRKGASVKKKHSQGGIDARGDLGLSNTQEHLGRANHCLVITPGHETHLLQSLGDRKSFFRLCCGPKFVAVTLHVGDEGRPTVAHHIVEICPVEVD